MKTLILVLLFLIGNSCDPVAKQEPVQIDENTTESLEEENSDTRPTIQESVNPNEITIKVKVMEVFDAGKNICGISKTNVMKMEVQEVLAGGSSIVNLPTKDNVVLMNFMLVPKELSLDTYIEAKAREFLCKDASETYFTIISYKIVE